MRYAFLILALAASAAQAQRTPPEGAAAHEKAEDKQRTTPGAASKGVLACHADLDKFCHDVKAGEGRLGACLKKNSKKLSKKCKAWLAHGGQAHADEAFGELDKPVTPAPSTR